MLFLNAPNCVYDSVVYVDYISISKHAPYFYKALQHWCHDMMMSSILEKKKLLSPTEMWYSKQLNWNHWLSLRHSHDNVYNPFLCLFIASIKITPCPIWYLLLCCCDEWVDTQNARDDSSSPHVLCKASSATVAFRDKKTLVTGYEQP